MRHDSRVSSRGKGRMALQNKNVFTATVVVLVATAVGAAGYFAGERRGFERGYTEATFSSALTRGHPAMEALLALERDDEAKVRETLDLYVDGAIAEFSIRLRTPQDTGGPISEVEADLFRYLVEFRRRRASSLAGETANIGPMVERAVSGEFDEILEEASRRITSP